MKKLLELYEKGLLSDEDLSKAIKALNAKNKSKASDKNTSNKPRRLKDWIDSQKQVQNEEKSIDSKLDITLMQNREELFETLEKELQKAKATDDIQDVEENENRSDESLVHGEKLSNEDEEEIVYEEDGSRFTKAREFFRKPWRKAIAIGAVLGLAGLTYFLIKHGQVDQAQEVIQNVSNSRDVAFDNLNNDLSDLANRTDVGTINQTFCTNDDAVQNINALTPNEYHQNEIINAVTSDNEILPAHNFGDVANYASEGKDITSIQVGNGYGIDGHVNTFDGEPLKEQISNYNSLKEGVRVRE